MSKSYPRENIYFGQYDEKMILLNLEIESELSYYFSQLQPLMSVFVLNASLWRFNFKVGSLLICFVLQVVVC